MNAIRIDASALRAFERDLHGDAVSPDRAGYAEARAVYNAMHERWPALVVHAADAADVAHTVRFAAEEGLMLAVRGGNHSMRGFGSCDDGVVIDLSALNGVEIDPGRRTARVGGGATWADVNDATHRHGLATTGGLISTTGVGGLTLGGGIGYLTRRMGLACDNLVAAELVTADGRILHVDAESEPDLFRALRGGGGNFGVVTSFTFRLEPVAMVTAGPIVFDLTADALRHFMDVMSNAPRELGAILGLTVAPPLPFLPAERHGSPAAITVACWSGPPAAGRDVLHDLAAGSPWGQAVREMPYPEINTLFDGLLPRGLRHYWKSTFITALDADGRDTFARHGRATPTIESGIFLYPVDGAAHDIGADETVWPHRDARFLTGIHGSWHDAAEDDRMRAWVRGSHAALAPFGTPDGYTNFASDDDASAGFGRLTARLVEAKRRWDPANLFCLNANIDPD